MCLPLKHPCPWRDSNSQPEDSYTWQDSSLTLRLWVTPCYPSWSWAKGWQLLLYRSQNFLIEFTDSLSSSCSVLILHPLKHEVHLNSSDKVIYYLSVAIQSFVGSWPIFQFPNHIHSRYDSLDGGWGRRKAVTYTRKNTNTEKLTQTSMAWMGFEPTIPAFERAKTVHALDCPATVIGHKVIYYLTENTLCLIYKDQSANAV
jgi:hypothetical protein